MYPDDMLVQGAIVDDRLLFTAGGQDALKSLWDRAGRSPGKLPFPLQETIARLDGASFGFAGQIDVTQLLSTFLTIGSAAGEATPLHPKDLVSIGPTPIRGYFAVHGEDWLHGMTLDADAAGQLGELFDRLEATFGPGEF